MMDIGIYSIKGARYMIGEEPIWVTAQETKTNKEKFIEGVDETVFQRIEVIRQHGLLLQKEFFTGRAKFTPTRNSSSLPWHKGVSHHLTAHRNYEKHASQIQKVSA